MRTETVSAAQANDDLIANRRILRLALGTSLSLCFSQAVGWDLSFIAPVFTLLLLSTPAPPPKLTRAVVLVLALVLPVVIGRFFLVPFFAQLKSVAIFLVSLALFHSFHLTARGGSQALGTLLTIGITLVVTIGSVSPAALSSITQGLAMGAAAGLVFVWVAHALLPDIRPPKSTVPGAVAEAGGETTAAQHKPSDLDALRLSLRALFVVLPITILFLFSPSSTNYIVVMMKVAAMGQQTESAASRNMGLSLIESTFWGGAGAIIVWQLLSIWPSLGFYSLLMAIAGLSYGRRLFRGAGMHARAEMWSYAFLTMVVLIAPAVLDSAGGSAAGAAFWTRLVLIGAAAAYGGLAVLVFDAFWPKARRTAASA